MRLAERLEHLPPYLFAELDRKVAAKRAEGADIISLSVGDPDLPTPGHIVAALEEAARDPSTHRYPSYFGLPAFREAIAGWYGRRFGLTFDPDREVLPLIGSKEGIAHIALALVDPGDEVLVPDPGYPVFSIGTMLAGGRSVLVPLSPEHGFLPDMAGLRPGPRAQWMWLGSPNNPTAAVADLSFFERAVAFAARHDLLLSHDAAHADLP